MKKKLFTLSAALIFAVCSMFFCISASAEVYEGDCGADGDNVTYKLDTSTGVLEFTGTEMMTLGYTGYYPSHDGFYSNAPWGSLSLKDYVKNVVISEGITNIGGFAFGGCKNLTSITIPDSITVLFFQHLPVVLACRL